MPHCKMTSQQNKNNFNKNTLEKLKPKSQFSVINKFWIIFIGLCLLFSNVFSQKKLDVIDRNILSNRDLQNQITGKYTDEKTGLTAIIGPGNDGNNLEYLCLYTGNKIPVRYGLLEFGTIDQKVCIVSKIKYFYGMEYAPEIHYLQFSDNFMKLKLGITDIMKYLVFGPNVTSQNQKDKLGDLKDFGQLRKESIFTSSEAVLLNKYRPVIEVELVDNNLIVSSDKMSWKERSNEKKLDFLKQSILGNTKNEVKIIIRNKTGEALNGLRCGIYYDIRTGHDSVVFNFLGKKFNFNLNTEKNEQQFLPPIPANDSLLFNLSIQPNITSRIDTFKLHFSIFGEQGGNYQNIIYMKLRFEFPYSMDENSKVVLQERENKWKKHQDTIKYLENWEKHYKFSIPSPEYSAMKFFIDSLYNPEEGLMELMEYDKKGDLKGTLWLALLSDLKLIFINSNWYWKQKAVALTNNGTSLDSNSISLKNTQNLLFKDMIFKFRKDLSFANLGKFHEKVEKLDRRSYAEYAALRNYPPAVYWYSYYMAVNNSEDLKHQNYNKPQKVIFANKNKFQKAYVNWACSYYLNCVECSDYAFKLINTKFRLKEVVDSLMSSSKDNNPYFEFCKGLFCFKNKNFLQMKLTLENLLKENSNSPLKIGYAAELAMMLYGTDLQLSEEDEIMIKSTIDLAEKQGLSSAIVWNAYSNLLKNMINTNSDTISAKDYENILYAAICGNTDAILLMKELNSKETTKKYNVSAAVAWKNYFTSVKGYYESSGGQSWWSSYFNNFSVKYKETTTTTYFNGQYQGTETDYSADVFGSYFDSYVKTWEQELAQKQPYFKEYQKFDFGEFYVVQGNVMGTTPIHLKLLPGEKIQTVIGGRMTSGLPAGKKYNPELNPSSEFYEVDCISPNHPYMNLIYNVDGDWKSNLPNKIEKETIIKEIAVNDKNFINNYGYYTFTIFVFKSLVSDKTF
jgi:hypothetical protein